MSEKIGIKETRELFIALAKLAAFGGKVSADGKIGLDDLPALVELGSSFDELAEGVKDISKAKDEIKDLDQAEIIELVGLVYEAIAEFKSAKSA